MKILAVLLALLIVAAPLFALTDTEQDQIRSLQRADTIVAIVTAIVVGILLVNTRPRSEAGDSGEAPDGQG